MVNQRQDKVLYFNKGLTRKKQIYGWFMDVVFANGLGNRFKNVINLGMLGERQKALNEFVGIVDFIVENEPMGENGDVLAYILADDNLGNFRAFGKASVILDLFNGTVLTRTGIIRKRPKEEVEKITITRLKEEIKEDIIKNIFLGINTVGTNEQGILKIRTNNTFYLQSRKTGRFLKLPESLKKELRKRNQ